MNAHMIKEHINKYTAIVSIKYLEVEHCMNIESAIIIDLVDLNAVE